MSAWFAKGEIVRQCVELVVAAAAGVLLYYVPFRLLKRRQGVRGMMLLELTAQAAATGLVMFSCFTMVLPHLRAAHMSVAGSPGFLPPPEALYYLAGVAVGGGLVVQTHRLFGDGNPDSGTIAMLVHSLAEGAGLGLLVGGPGFDAIFRSQVLHGVPDGMLAAVLSLERAGLSHAMRSAVLSRAGQAAAFYATAVYAPRLSDEVCCVMEGFGLGSLSAMAWSELARPAADGLGSFRAASIAFATAFACHFALG